MRLSRLNYDKVHRCPTWSGGGWKPANGKHEYECSASFAQFIYYKKGTHAISRTWPWRFTRCPRCRVLCLPFVTRWADLSWLGWRYGPEYRRIYGRKSA